MDRSPTLCSSVPSVTHRPATPSPPPSPTSPTPHGESAGREPQNPGARPVTGRGGDDGGREPHATPEPGSADPGRADPGRADPEHAGGRAGGATVLVAGCGDLGTEVALRLSARGESVVGVRRRAEVLPAGVRGLSVDLTREIPHLPPGSYERLAVILTADGRDAEAYRETYVGGLRRTLAALDAAGVRPQRAVLVSSTGVYGDSVGDIDESTPVAPSRPTHDVLLEAEELIAHALPHATVLRLSGLYGPGRSRFIEKARRGEVDDHWTNRIHRDDAAAAIVHLLGAAAPAAGAPADDRRDGAAVARLYLGTDRLPAHAVDVADEIRRLEGLPPLTPRPRAGEQEGRRLDSSALVGTGFAFTHPTYVEGYAAVLGGAGRRHP